MLPRRRTRRWANRNGRTRTRHARAVSKRCVQMFTDVKERSTRTAEVTVGVHRALKEDKLFRNDAVCVGDNLRLC